MKNKQPKALKRFYIIAALVLLSTGIIAGIASPSPRLKSGDGKVELDYSSTVDDVEPKDAELAEKIPATQKFSESSDVSEPQPEPQKNESTTTADSSDEAAPTVGENYLSFSMPIKGTVAKQFDAKQPQLSKTFGDMRLHTGIDIVAAEGTPVCSAAEGTVKSVDFDPIWGKVVTLSHGSLTTRYCGLDEVKVKKGDSVKKNKVLGTLGTVPCECMDTAHLHFEIKNGAEYLSPLDAIGE